MDIGERAAQAIRERAAKKGISPVKEAEHLGTSRKTYRDWAFRGRNPCGYWLQQMALAGYDIHWILTGEIRYPVTEPDFDISEYEEES